ncbi:MAG: chorismate-binding protein [Cyclobacteriaceae bacterium]|nr:chorismate-binding protein [Cyclobacteriaceae bacterium]MCB0500762.1 chorismate-binding protein [Cyclobacteriaceae bacterium]MCB9236703.1 chorismate-binding protein [Flammeovirgaceae bacterium]MCO5272624.1 chorismate-binding protein [Cyclobacteriaceae bacterium]MCW5901982.1 chorismate-binding protein [Cyclobacteriaceae bacterium]
MNFKIFTRSKKLLADTLTPVNIYLKLRDVYAGSFLLESSDYHGHENSLSFICCCPMASFQVDDGRLAMKYPDGSTRVEALAKEGGLIDKLDEFKNAFELQQPATKYISGGLFGYMAYDAVRYVEDINLARHNREIPDVWYKVFRYVIVVDHFSNQIVLHENTVSPDAPSGLEELQRVIYSNRFSTFSFSALSGEASNISDEEYVKMVAAGISHCRRGDVFQIVLSRRFTSQFQGDEFNVYRALRSINPSPYLFYFDFGKFKIFGSSPEAQIQIKGNEAAIYPIAGTFRRTGDDKEDAKLATGLSEDEKENAEHVMLVDLARNDMGRDAEEVKVEVFKEIQYYSHVIHLVSKVTGKIKDGTALRVAANTFPAGTLSGAPKHKAMTLIDQYENVNRGFYGGAIGFLGFNGDFNHAIMIRTFLSKGNTLITQAGAGIVAKSDPQKELQEVNNKLEALRKAIKMAEGL